MAETVDFLRRLASMMTGGRNAEMLLEASDMIEALAHRATSAERLYHEQSDDHARDMELRKVVELAADNLIAEVESMSAHLTETKQQARAEIARLKVQLAESNQQMEKERAGFEEETRRITALAEAAESRLADANASLEALYNPATARDSVVMASIQSLQLARTQFGFLADGFAESGDVVSLAICEIGACAIENALAGPANESD